MYRSYSRMSFPIKRISQSNNKGFIVSVVLFCCCNPKLSTIKGPLHFIFSCCSQTDFGWKNVFFLQGRNWPWSCVPWWGGNQLSMELKHLWKLAFGVVVWKSLANSFLKIWKKDFPWEYLLRIGECSILQSLSYLGYDDPYFCCFLVWREIGSSDCECWYLPYQQRPSSRVSSAPKTAGYSLCTVG